MLPSRTDHAPHITYSVGLLSAITNYLLALYQGESTVVAEPANPDIFVELAKRLKQQPSKIVEVKGRIFQANFGLLPYKVNLAARQTAILNELNEKLLREYATALNAITKEFTVSNVEKVQHIVTHLQSLITISIQPALNDETTNVIQAFFSSSFLYLLLQETERAALISPATSRFIKQLLIASNQPAEKAVKELQTKIVDKTLAGPLNPQLLISFIEQDNEDKALKSARGVIDALKRLFNEKLEGSQDLSHEDFFQLGEDGFRLLRDRLTKTLEDVANCKNHKCAQVILKELAKGFKAVLREENIQCPADFTEFLSLCIDHPKQVLKGKKPVKTELPVKPLDLSKIEEKKHFPTPRDIYRNLTGFLSHREQRSTESSPASSERSHSARSSNSPRIPDPNSLASKLKLNRAIGVRNLRDVTKINQGNVEEKSGPKPGK